MCPNSPNIKRIFHYLLRLPGAVLVLLVRAYQLLISPWLGPRCRYVPTCSEYFVLAVEKYGAIKGTCKGVWRVCRCHPWSKGGYDPP